MEVLHQDLVRALQLERSQINLARYLSGSVGDDDISLGIIPIFACTHEGDETVVTALLDDGAQVSVITQGLADRLGLEGVPMTARIEAIGGKVTEYSTISAKLHVAPSTASEDVHALQEIEVVVIKDPTTNGPAIDWRRAARDVPDWSGLNFPKLK